MHRTCVLVAASVCVSAVALAANPQFEFHPLHSVVGGDRVVVVYAGMPVTVRLAHVVLPDSKEGQAAAMEKIEEMVKGKQVRPAYCPEAGLDVAGLPQVFLIVGIKNVNEELVHEGLARYEDGGKPSQYYHKKMASADSQARKRKAGIWAQGEATAIASTKPAPAATSTGEVTGVAAKMIVATAEPAGVVYSELNSTQYHQPTCRWAQQMSPQRRIRYASVDAAERTGKRPCFICFEQAAKSALPGAGDRTVRIVPGVGPLAGSKGVFHAPNCDTLPRDGAGCTSYATVKAATAAGLTPCTECLRLSGGMIPLPEKGECIGRAPPGRRPCRRAPADESGLCLYCLGKE